MRVALLTREYPPQVYGGGGVHVEYLARELRALVELTVHCWGPDRPDAVAYRSWDALAGEAPHLAALRAMSIDLAMAAGVQRAEVVHSHTWYTNLAGHLAKLTYGTPHVATVHSLEPLRPWKAGQLGGGYALSSFCERVGLEGADAVIAVSESMRRDLLSCYAAIAPERVAVVHNGIDTDEYRPAPDTATLERHGVDPDRPSVVFVGRITQQKGLPHLLDAAPELDPSAQLVLCAGAPDTPEMGADVRGRVETLRAERGNVIWIEEMLPRRDVIGLLTHATVFVCPSVYEPLGIVNLEAMACETAVVATATGGIVEVVHDGVTGLLVPFEPSDPPAVGPRDPARFSHAIAERVNALLADPARAVAMGKAGRQRAVTAFDWTAIAHRTVEIYDRTVPRGASSSRSPLTRPWRWSGRPPRPTGP